MSENLVLVETDGHLCTITLNRPAKLNALNPDMLEALERAVRDIDRDNALRVVVLTGAGDRAFCVGADITSWSTLEPIQMWREWVRAGHRVFDTLARMRQPVIAALNGFTLGGGLELAMAADLRIAAEGIELGAPEVKIGTVPGWAGTSRLPELVGVARAKQLILTGARIDARTAEHWGLVNEVVARERLTARVREVVAEIAANAPIAVQLAKQLIDAGRGAKVSATLEAIAGGLAATTDDGQEGVASFREKREPRFTGN
jgi:enoyl-CoA hydratase/carnithine racemase